MGLLQSLLTSLLVEFDLLNTKVLLQVIQEVFVLQLILYLKTFNAVLVIPDFFAPNAPPLTASIVDGATAAVPATVAAPNAGR